MRNPAFPVASIVLAIALFGGCAARIQGPVAVDRAPADAAVFPVVPFDMIYIYGTDHVIAFLDDHPRYDAVEVTLIEGSLLLFIVTLKDMTQIDYMNSRPIVEQRQTGSNAERPCEYADIEFRREDRDDGSVAVYSKATLASGEVIEIDFVSEPEVIPWPRGVVMPTGGHSQQQSVVAMTPGGSGAAFANASSRVRIDGQEVAAAPLGEDGSGGLMFGPGSGDRKLFFWLDGFDLRILMTADRVERVIERTSEGGLARWVSVVGHGAATKTYDELGTDEIDGVEYRQIRQGGSFNDTIAHLRRISGGVEIKRLEAVTLGGRRTTLDFSPPVVVLDKIPDDEERRAFSLFSLGDHQGDAIIRGRLDLQARNHEDQVVTEYQLHLTDPSYIAWQAMNFDITRGSDDLHVVSGFGGPVDDVVPDQVTPYEHLTWVDSFLLPKDKTIIFLPLGAIEEHGPHLPLATDALGAADLARATADQFKASHPDWAVLVAPLVPYGHADYGMGFSGNISIRAEVLREYIRDICESQARHGYRNLVVVGHQMEPRHMVGVQQAVDDVRSRYPIRIVSPTEALLLGMVEAKEEELAADAEGEHVSEDDDAPSFGHASVGETSMVLYHYPELVDREMLALLPEYDVGFPDNLNDKPDFKEARMELGYSGDPTWAENLYREIGGGYFTGWGAEVAQLSGEMVAGEPDAYDRGRSFLVDLPAFQLEEGVTFGGAAPGEVGELETDDVTYIARQLERIQVLSDEGSTAEALAMAEELVERHPNSADAHAWKGSLLGYRAGEVGGMEAARAGMSAAQEFELALYLDPDNALAYMGVGMLKLFTPEDYGGSPDVAIENLERALELSDDVSFRAQVLTFLGKAWRQKGDLAAARQHLEQALALDPGNTTALEEMEQLGE